MAEDVVELSIGQVAERVGVSVHTLRFYEREGLLAFDVRRDSGGRRVYTEADVVWLSAICLPLRNTDMPLPDIRRYTELVRAGSGNEEERMSIMHEHQRRVRSRMAQLQECLDMIDYKVRVYEEHLAAGRAERLWSREGVLESVATEGP